MVSCRRSDDDKHGTMMPSLRCQSTDGTWNEWCRIAERHEMVLNNPEPNKPPGKTPSPGSCYQQPPVWAALIEGVHPSLRLLDPQQKL